jgi:predicted ester cyclase
MDEKSIIDNKFIVREYIEKIVNTGNIEHISDFISSDYVEVFQNQSYRLGIEGAIRHIIGVRETYPDLTMTIEKQIAEGDWVVTCYTMTGTHLGVWMDIRPTRKKIITTGVNVDRVVNGKIIEHSGAANLFNSLLDIEAIKLIKEKE